MSSRLAPALAFLLFLSGSTAAMADQHEEVEVAEEAEVVEAAPAESTGPADALAALDGRTIYSRVLDNRFQSYLQSIEMESGDRSKNIQNVAMDIKYKSFREESDKFLSKSIAKYDAPQDVRHLGYLVINKASGQDDQFIYRPSTRRVARINLKGEAIFGTDFSLEDILPKELEDGTYKRMPDETVEGIDCFVVEVTPNEDQDSEYSRFIAYVDKSNYVPVVKRYWDTTGVQTKELKVDPASVKTYEDEENGEVKRVYMPHKSRIDHLKLGTFTELRVVELEANPGFRDKDFSQRKLTSSR